MKQYIAPIVIAAELLAGASLMTGCVVPSANGAGSSEGAASTNPDTNPSPSGGGQSYYTQNVDPKLQANCASCHATGNSGAPIWLAQGDAEGSYNLIKTYKDGRLWQPAGLNPLLLKGKHAGPELSGEGVSAVTAWLDLEFQGGGSAAPPPGDGTPSGAAADAIKAFSDCMSFDNWLTENMDKWSFLQTVEDGSCAGCHEQGNAGTWIQADKEENYKNNRKLPFIFRIASPVYESGRFDHLEPSTRLIDKATKSCFQKAGTNDVEVCHATYVVPAILKNSVQNFFNDTNAKIKNNKCTEPQPR